MDISLHTLAAVVLKNKSTSSVTVPPETDEASPLPEPEPPAERLVNITLIRNPNSGMKGLVRIRQQLDLSLSIGELLNKVNCLPLSLLEGVIYSVYQQRCIEISSTEDCIEISEALSGEKIEIC